MGNKLRKVKRLKEDLGCGHAIPGPCCFVFLISLIEVWLVYNAGLVSGV